MPPPSPADPPRILIIDDDASAIQLLQSYLKDHGRIWFSNNGVDGLARAMDLQPDLILLDADMPGMDGFEVCAVLKADDRLSATPVIFVTSFSDIDSETRALHLGAADFITKPFSPPVVKARVCNHLLLKQHFDFLRQRASTDGLTGVANRRAFDEALEMEWRRGLRRHEPLALLMLDVDCFKRFNDHYGHPAGDDCLRAVAGALGVCAQRSGDLAARYGGEEFVLLMPNTPAAGAMAIAETLRARVMALGIPHAHSEVAEVVTVSIGVFGMQLPCVDSPGESSGCPHPERRVTCLDGPLSLVKAADRGLYLAKGAGRNRVMAGTLDCGE